MLFEHPVRDLHSTSAPLHINGIIRTDMNYERKGLNNNINAMQGTFSIVFLLMRKPTKWGYIL